jgi:signal transduction histidine kinase
LDIYVLPAWWEHTWFYITLLIVLALLFWFVIKLRTRYWRQRSHVFEEAVQSRTLELEQSEEKLRDQLYFQRMLNENITHDVNAPLKYLSIYTGEMVEHVRNNKLPDIEEVEYIHSSTNKIYALVENLTQFLKTKYKQPTLSGIHVWKLVQQKLELFSIGAKRKNILLKNEVDHKLFIKDNETLLAILLHNLIDNALKYTARGSVLITSGLGKDGKVSLHIRDTGSGMSGEQVQKFNAIFKSPAAHKSDIPSGFGFTIVKEIAHILQVSVHIESAPNEGTEITVTLSAYNPVLPQA